MEVDHQQENFEGNPEDLRAFLELAKSPIRSEARSQALDAWRQYKQQKLAERWPAVSEEHLHFGKRPPVSEYQSNVMPAFGPFMKGWSMVAMQKHLIDLSGINLDGLCLGYVDLRGVKLDSASLRGAWLKGAEVEWASLKEADFSMLESEGMARASRLIQCDFSNTDMEGCNLSNADLSGSNFRNAMLSHANFVQANLTGVNLVGTDLRHADLRGSRVYGTSTWDVELCDKSHLRQNLIITEEDAPEVHVDDLEVAQFIYLLLNRKKLRNVINAVTQKGVVILGRFGDGGLDILQGVADSLRERGYLPMLFDFDKPDQRDYTETVQTLAGLARFVVVDLSGPSVPQELMATVPNFEIPFIPILRQGLRPHSMFRDLLKYRWVHPDITFFTNADELQKQLATSVIAPAEQLIEDIQQRKSSF